MPDRLTFTKDGTDITYGIDLKNGKANAFGWSTYEVWLKEHAGEDWIEYQIGDLYCGEPKNMSSGFGWRIEKDAECR